MGAGAPAPGCLREIYGIVILDTACGCRSHLLAGGLAAHAKKRPFVSVGSWRLGKSGTITGRCRCGKPQVDGIGKET